MCLLSYSVGMCSRAVIYVDILWHPAYYCVNRPRTNYLNKDNLNTGNLHGVLPAVN